MDETGRWVVWLTENTEENQKKVFERNPALQESNTIFKTADYSLDDLTDLMAVVSQAMGRDEFSFITTAALREERNRVEVTVTSDAPEDVEKVLAFDPLGGAIEIRYAAPDTVEPTKTVVMKGAQEGRE